MDLELHKKLTAIKEKSNNNYIISKLKTIRDNDDIQNITSNEVKLILELIKVDYNNDKENLIQSILEENYETEKFKILNNKDKYIKKQKNIILSIIDSIKNYFSNKYKINNDYSLGYCKSYAQLFIDGYKVTKYYKIMKWIIIKLSILEEQYSDKLKSLYRLSNSYEELSKIRKYESIDRNYRFQQQEQMSNTITAMGKNVKTLKYNCDRIVDNGFFGL